MRTLVIHAPWLTHFNKLKSFIRKLVKNQGLKLSEIADRYLNGLALPLPNDTPL